MALFGPVGDEAVRCGGMEEGAVGESGSRDGGVPVVADAEVAREGTDNARVGEGSGTAGRVRGGAEACHRLRHFCLGNGVVGLGGLQGGDAAEDEAVRLRERWQSAVDLDLDAIEAVTDVKLGGRLEVRRPVGIDDSRRGIGPGEAEDGIKHIIGDAVEDLSARNDVVGVGVVMMVEPSEHVIEGTIFQHENDEVIELSGHAFLLCTHAFCSEPIFGDAEKSTPSEEDRQPGKKMISLLIYPFKFS